jgi:hypothetical protein
MQVFLLAELKIGQYSSEFLPSLERLKVRKFQSLQKWRSPDCCKPLKSLKSDDQALTNIDCIRQRNIGGCRAIGYGKKQTKLGMMQAKMIKVLQM